MDGDNFTWFAVIIVETSLPVISTTTTGTAIMYNNYMGCTTYLDKYVSLFIDPMVYKLLRIVQLVN